MSFLGNFKSLQPDIFEELGFQHMSRAVNVDDPKYVEVRENTPQDQIVDTRSTFGDNSIKSEHLDQVPIDKLIAGSLQVKVEITSPDYVANTTGFRLFAGDPENGLPSSLDIMNGNFSGTITAASMTIGASGYLRSGKTSFSDSVNAGYYLGNTTEGVYFGAASDASFIKYNIGTGKVTIKADINSNSNMASDTYNFSAGLVVPNAVGAKNMGFPIAFGSGVDGDLTISTTTQVDTTKQYNNVTINNGGVLTSNLEKTLFIAIKGTLTINVGGIISMKGKGSIGGSGGLGALGAGNVGGSGNTGSSGAGSGAGVDYLDFTTRAGSSAGGGGQGGYMNTFVNGAPAGNGGSGYSLGGIGGYIAGAPATMIGGAGSNVLNIIKNRTVLNQNILLTLWGAGGGGGSGGSHYTATSGGNGGTGGTGGGLIYIECYNLVINETTNAINASGNNGNNGTDAIPSASTDGGGGGGGGGSGGCIFLRYHTMTNANGTNSNLIVSGGSGGNHGLPNSSGPMVANGVGGVGGLGLVFLQQI